MQAENRKEFVKSLMESGKSKGRLYSEDIEENECTLSLGPEEMEKIYEALKQDGIEIIEDFEYLRRVIRNAAEEKEKAGTPFPREFVPIKELPAQDEIDLAVRFGNGDIQAKTELFRTYEWLVLSLVIRYIGSGVPFPELVLEGKSALAAAADHFDCTKGFRFPTCAIWRIRSAIAASIRKYEGKERNPDAPEDWEIIIFGKQQIQTIDLKLFRKIHYPIINLKDFLD